MDKSIKKDKLCPLRLVQRLKLHFGPVTTVTRSVIPQLKLNSKLQQECILPEKLCLFMLSVLWKLLTCILRGFAQGGSKHSKFRICLAQWVPR